MISKLWDGNHTQYISFKETNENIQFRALYTNNIVNIKTKFEILEDVSVNQLVTVDRERFLLKGYLISLKSESNNLFIGAEQGMGKHSKDAFVIIAPNQKLQAMKWTTKE